EAGKVEVGTLGRMRFEVSEHAAGPGHILGVVLGAFPIRLDADQVTVAAPRECAGGTGDPGDRPAIEPEGDGGFLRRCGHRRRAGNALVDPVPRSIAPPLSQTSTVDSSDGAATACARRMSTTSSVSAGTFVDFQ